MSASRTLSGKSNDPTVISAPRWPALSAEPAGPLPQAQAQHTAASARQARYATVRRSGPALIAFRAGREEEVAPHAPEPGIRFLQAAARRTGRRWRPAGKTGAR